jgi:L-ascorbate metabolism protein UlaG (beta-lactamase superfamily)
MQRIQMENKRDGKKKEGTSKFVPARRGFLKNITAAAVGGAAAGIAPACAHFTHHAEHPHGYRTSWECGCTGGPVPHKSSHHVVFRWLGSVNFEICYRDQVFLFNNYYDKAPQSLKGTWRYPDLGFAAKDVARATALFIGHAHFDHMSDTALVAKQTGAPIFGHKTVHDKLVTQGIDTGQITRIKTGDVFNFRGVTVEAVHMYHSSLFNTIMPAESANHYHALMAAEWGYPPLTDEEQAEMEAIREKGSWAPDIKEFGTYGFLFTFENDFTVFLYDSHNSVLTDEFKAVMARLGSVDIGTVGYQGGTAERLSEYVWPVVLAYQAKYLWPTHNDVTPTGRQHVATQHLAQTAKNNFPDRHTIISLYREPVCFDIKKHRRISLDME